MEAEVEFEKGKDRVVMNVQMASKKRENDVQKSWKEYKWENNRMWGEELKDGGYLGELRGISLGLKVICGVPIFCHFCFHIVRNLAPFHHCSFQISVLFLLHFEKYINTPFSFLFYCSTLTASQLQT